MHVALFNVKKTFDKTNIIISYIYTFIANYFYTLFELIAHTRFGPNWAIFSDV
jgi:hypothetical protein